MNEAEKEVALMRIAADLAIAFATDGLPNTRLFEFDEKRRDEAAKVISGAVLKIYSGLSEGLRKT